MKPRTLTLSILGGLVVAAAVPLAVLGISKLLTPRTNDTRQPGGPVARVDDAPVRDFGGARPRVDVPPRVDVADDLVLGDILGGDAAPLPGGGPIGFRGAEPAGKPVDAEELKDLNGPVVADAGRKISGPFRHNNLSVFLVHGPGAKARPMLTLQEGIERGLVVVHAAGISIDNRSDQPLFIQAGDIIKGGTQDRTLPNDYLIPANATRFPVAVFCVESGRSFARAGESSTSFGAATQFLPTRDLRLAAYRKSQGDVWGSVSRLQGALASSLGGSVKARLSETSLQLTLEHPLVQDGSQKYLNRLLFSTDKKDDVIGFVAVVNGKIISADIYATPELFQKQWQRLLQGAVVDALASPTRGAVTEASVDQVEAFLSVSGSGASRHETGGSTYLLRQDTTLAHVFDTCERGGGVLHRTLLAK